MTFSKRNRTLKDSQRVITRSSLENVSSNKYDKMVLTKIKNIWYIVIFFFFFLYNFYLCILCLCSNNLNIFKENFAKKNSRMIFIEKLKKKKKRHFEKQNKTSAIRESRSGTPFFYTKRKNFSFSLTCVLFLHSKQTWGLNSSWQFECPLHWHDILQ